MTATGIPVDFVIIRANGTFNLRGRNLFPSLLEAKKDLFLGQVAIEIEGSDKLLLIRRDLARRNTLGASHFECWEVSDGFKLSVFSSAGREFFLSRIVEI